MSIHATWQKSINLVKVKKGNFIFEINIEKFPKIAGCYVIYNQYGNASRKILYIGQAINLKSRIKYQLNNLELMTGINKSMKGSKKILFCTVQFKGKQSKNKKKVLNVLEKNLIKMAILDDHPLLNKQGKKITDGDIIFDNNVISKYFFKKDKITLQK